MRNLLRTAGRAVGSGRFLTPWSIAASLPLSLTVMAPTGDGVDPLNALVATGATWLCFGAALAVVAALERWSRTRRARTAIVIAGIIVCAALRPVVQDGWLHLSGFPTPPTDQLPFRIATNIVVWAVVLSILAVLESSLRSLRRANALLRSVAQELARAKDEAQVFATDAGHLVDRARATLDAAIVELEPTSAGIRRLGGEQIRKLQFRADNGEVNVSWNLHGESIRSRVLLPLLGVVRLRAEASDEGTPVIEVAARSLERAPQFLEVDLRRGVWCNSVHQQRIADNCSREQLTGRHMDDVRRAC